jgi:PhnB protein
MSVKPIPDGFHTVTPYLVVGDAAKLLDFLQAAFDAEVIEKMTLPDGTVNHAMVRIGDSIIMTGTTRPPYPPMPTMLYIYVPDADSLYAKALAAGATSIRELVNEFYGDRVGAVRDVSGNQWWLATHIEDVSPGELRRRNEEARAHKS